MRSEGDLEADIVVFDRRDDADWIPGLGFGFGRIVFM